MDYLAIDSHTLAETFSSTPILSDQNKDSFYKYIIGFIKKCIKSKLS